MAKNRALMLDEIIREAAKCFGDMGYRATTLEAIAARVGISKVTLYRYVSSKEELLCLVFERTIESFRTGLGQIIAQEVPADEKLRRIIRYQVNLLASHLPFLTVFFSEESDLPPQMAQRVAREKRDYDRAIERVVQEGINAGLFRDMPPTLFVFALLGMCNWLYKWYKAEGKLSPDDIATFFIALLEHGYLRQAPAAPEEPLRHVLQRIEARLARLEDRLEGCCTSQR